MSSSIPDLWPAGRIAQVDAVEYEEGIVNILWQRIKAIFDEFEVNIGDYTSDARSVLKGLLMSISLLSQSCTFGQDMIDLEYRQHSGYMVPSRLSRICYVGMLTGFPCLLSKVANSIDISSGPRVTVLSEVAWLIHFFIFIVHGRYQLLAERLLGMRTFHRSKPDALGYIDFEYKNREVLWHGFASIAIYILPLVNYRRLINQARRLIGSTRGQPGNSIDTTKSTSRALITLTALSSCAFCNQYPVLPLTYGCSHVMCHSCAYGNLAVDSGFCCPECNASVIRESLSLWQDPSL